MFCCGTEKTSTFDELNASNVGSKDLESSQYKESNASYTPSIKSVKIAKTAVSNQSARLSKIDEEELAVEILLPDRFQISNFKERPREKMNLTYRVKDILQRRDKLYPDFYCKPQSKVEELEKTISSLNAQIEQLKNENATLAKEVIDLRNQREGN